MNIQNSAIFSEVAQHLYSLIDTEPCKAIEETRALKEDANSLSLKAAVFIDAGSAIKDSIVIDEGVAIVRKLFSEYPDNTGIQYNLANGVWLYARALCESIALPDWYLKTTALRREARFHFNDVANTKTSPTDLTTQAYNNKGNVLKASYRWVEAYDAYVNALEQEPRNGVAAANIVKTIQECLSLGIGDTDALLNVANKYAQIAGSSSELIQKFAGIHIQESLAQTMPLYINDTTDQILHNLDPYQTFIASHRLALSLTIEGGDFSLPRWDSLMIESIYADLEAGSEVPPIFAMFNTMKADYLAARWLAFTAIQQELPESGVFADTLDYSCYGIKYSLLTFAQRAALDVLDKIAVATADYLSISKAKKATFKGVWYKPSSQAQPDILEWKHEIRQEIQQRNVAAIALSEIAHDITNEQGYLKQKNVLRNASTHRFTVLHDIGMQGYREHSCIEHYDLAEFEYSAIETLQLARAALIYFVEMIARREQRMSAGKTSFPLHIPNHHVIRGQD